MKTYPIYRPDGSLFAFEITSAWLIFRPLYKILLSVDGVSDIHRNWFNDNRISFNFHSVQFVVNEPWGDNSRYWVGPESVDDSMLDVTPLHNAFQCHHSVIVKVWLWLANVKSANLTFKRDSPRSGRAP